MDVVITEWALQTYLDLKVANTFSDQEYRKDIRLDVERLKPGWPPTDAKFTASKFWGIAAGRGGAPVPGGYKMKWHQVGPGLVQLRLCVFIHQGRALLCNAYVKDSKVTDLRQVEKFRGYCQLIRQARHTERGLL